MQPRKKAAPLPEDSANSGASDSDETGKADITALLNKLRQTNVQRRNRKRKEISAGFSRELARAVQTSEQELENAAAEASKKRKHLVREIQKLGKQREAVELEIAKTLEEIKDIILTTASQLHNAMIKPGQS